MIGATWLVLVSVFWQIVGGKLPLDVVSAGVLIAALVISVPVWRSMGKIELARWRTYRVAVAAYLAATVAVTIAGLIVVYGAQSRELATAALMTMQSLFGERIVGHVAFDMLGIGSLLGLYGIRALLAAPVGPTRENLRDVLDRLDRRSAARPSVHQLPVIGRFKSAVAGLGAGLMYLFPVLPSLGPALLLFARRYGQAAADDLLAIDPRKPVLFLRSFATDQDDDLYAGQSVIGGMALEPRLARHFSAFGPFVAIGDPRDAVPKLGAARARRSDDAWQETIIEWMATSQLIVLVAGATKSVLWELGQCIANGHVAKLIVLFDEPVPWDNVQRLDHVRHAFRGTSWELGLRAIQSVSQLRAMRFSPDGTVSTVVSATVHYTEATHLAAIICHDHVLSGRGPTREA
jgi:hypothetical protein